MSAADNHPDRNSERWNEFGELGRFVDRLWRQRSVVLTTTFASTVIGVAYALSATEWYKAEVVLAPISSGSSLPASLSQLGGLANLAGINLGSSGDQRPVAVLRSKEFAQDFIVDYKLDGVLIDPPLMPFKSDPPDIRDAVRFFDESVRNVTEDKKAGIVILAIRWKDPTVAANWANILVVRLNDRLQRQAAQDAERNVNYLQQEISKTSVISLQESLGRVLEIEMQKLLLARGNNEFAFKVIDRATPPKLRDWPRRTLITVIAAALGVLLSVLIVIGRQHWVASRQIQ